MLKDIVVPKRVIQVDNDVSFEVHGLTLENLGELLQDYFEPLNKVMENNIQMKDLADQYPEFLAKVIALAADEPDEWKKIKQLGFALQMTAFEKVWDLTVPDYEALGKLVERIKGIIPKLQGNPVSE